MLKNGFAWKDCQLDSVEDVIGTLLVLIKDVERLDCAAHCRSGRRYQNC